MINNYSLIAPLLNFTDPDDFYYLLVLKRKKDQPEGEKQNHQSVRTMKAYCADSLTYIEERMPEIIDFCEHFKARAYIYINKFSHKNISLLMLQRLAERIRVGISKQKNLFDSVVGELHSTEHKWVVDVDNKELEFLETVKTEIASCEPKGYKVITELPTKNGYHLITNKFNTLQFADKFPNIEVHKHQPTMLYLPNSLQ